MILALLALALQSPAEASVPDFAVAEGWTLQVVGRGMAEDSVPLRTVIDPLGRSFEFTPAPRPFSLERPPEHDSLSLKARSVPESYFLRTPLLFGESHRAEGSSFHLPQTEIHEPWFPGDPIQPTLAVLSFPHADAAELVICGSRAQSVRALTVNFEGDHSSISTRRTLVRAAPHARVLFHSPRVLHPGKILFSDRVSLRIFELTSTLPQPEIPDCVRRSIYLRTLAENGAYGEEELLNALQEKDPRVCAAAVRWFEPQLRGASSEVIAALLRKLDGDEPTYARQLAFSLGEISNTAQGLRALCAILKRHCADPSLRLAVRTGIEGQEFELLRMLIHEKSWQDETEGHRKIIQELAQDVRQSTRRTELQGLLALALAPDRAPWQVDTIAEAIGIANDREWIEALDELRRDLEFDSSDQRGSFLRGQLIYEQSCIGCHTPSGYGHSAPSLRSRFSSGLREQSILRRALSRSTHSHPLEPEQLEALHCYLRLEWR